MTREEIKQELNYAFNALDAIKDAMDGITWAEKDETLQEVAVDCSYIKSIIEDILEEMMNGSIKDDVVISQRHK